MIKHLLITCLCTAGLLSATFALEPDQPANGEVLARARQRVVSMTATQSSDVSPNEDSDDALKPPTVEHGQTVFTASAGPFQCRPSSFPRRPCSRDRIRPVRFDQDPLARPKSTCAPCCPWLGSAMCGGRIKPPDHIEPPQVGDAMRRRGHPPEAPSEEFLRASRERSQRCGCGCRSCPDICGEACRCEVETLYRMIRVGQAGALMFVPAFRPEDCGCAN